MSAPEFAPRTASYQADPDEVHRVLLLYSGGLDTSVMLRWIQERYEAEVVTLTVNLGQPGEDYAVIEGKARQIGAVECHIVDAREEFAAKYIAPASRRTRSTAAATRSHRAGASPDRQARRRIRAALGLRHDRPRLHRQGQRPGPHRRHGRDARPELKVIAPVREWAMGREEEIAYAREHGIPSRGAPRSCPTRSMTTSGPLLRGPLDRGPRPRPRRGRLPARHAPASGARRASADRARVRGGPAVSLDGERLPLAALIERAGEIGAATASAS